MSDNRVRILASLEDKVSSGLDKIRDKFDQLGGKGAGASFFGNVGAKGLEMIGRSAKSAAGEVTQFVLDSIQQASNLSESLSKSNVVFGKAAAGVEEFGKSAAESFGMSEQAAVEASATLGNLFTGLGYGQKAAADMSTKMVALAGDLASFNNIGTDEALEKIRSGLAGESEPLRSMGVFLTEAKVKAKAMQMGLVDAHGELSEGSKVLARYQLILDETKTAQGDFERTSDGLANSQRKATAEMLNQQAALGEQLLPVQLAATKAQLSFFKGLNLVADGLSGNVTPAIIGTAAAQGQLGMITDKVREKIHDLDEETLNSATVAGIFTVAERDAEVATRKHGEAIAFMADHVKDDFSSAARAALDDGQKIGGIVEYIGKAVGTSADQFHAAMDDMVSDLRNAKRDLASAGQDAAAAWIDPQIAGLEKLKNAREIKETEAAIASGKLRGKELLDAKIHLLELKKDRIGLLVTLAESGDKAAATSLKHQAEVALSSKTLTKDQRAYWQAVLDKINSLDAAANDLNADLKRLSWQASHTKDDVAQIPGAMSVPLGARHGASGLSHVGAGEPIIVGDAGRPELYVPDSAGTLLSSVPTGGGVTIHVTYAPTVGLGSPAEMQAAAASLVPAITREMQRQRVL